MLRSTFTLASGNRAITTGQTSLRSYATHQAVAAARNHRVVVIGAGAAGLGLSHQLLRSGKFAPKDIALVDPAQWHHYQPGWTLVGGNLKNKEDLRKPLAGLINPKLQFYNNSVAAFSPEQNTVTLSNGDSLCYEHLVVAPGISINYDAIKGLPEALADVSAPVSTIYGYETCDKVFRTISGLKKGTAIFTQPTGVVKCAGAPQKAMWLALDHWKRAGLYDTSSNSPIKISFATGLPVMFGVPKYSQKLNQLREERNVEGLFQHDLESIDGDKATFFRADTQERVTKRFDLLHVVPKMGPHKFIKESQLADGAGFVDVDDSTLRHNKFPNIWAAGDSAGLPTSKTAAAITAQAPVLVRNLLQSLEGKTLDASYNGYTSCPLLTEYNKVMLAEFGYGGKPMETFGRVFDQSVPRRAFFHLKKDFFPWIYFTAMVKGLWGGPNGFIR
ncbi:sulfide,quinone oxidoreductase/flavo-binding protein [Aureobasidium pullulans]|uniref:Sulfide,quinone oxidoreductase/flavo-binding protein n=1 Tax=Aureobasidium pullulans TaxID=5580 RepID=A0A4S9VZH9_AURPU